MHNNLLVTTTYKNNFTLLEYFYKFYNKYWSPTNFLFIIGSTTSQQENIELINKILNINLSKLYSLNIGHNDNIVQNINIYVSQNIYVLIYDTYVTYENNQKWDALRNYLFDLIHNKLPQKGINNFKHDYYINVDNDDFLYTFDSEKTLQNNNNVFPTLELIPKETFNINDTLKFINCPYYFQHKSENKNLIDNIGTFYRIIDFKNPVYNCIHKFPDCEKYIKHDTNEVQFNINKIEHCCFAFTCLSLKHLIEEKYWDHTDKLMENNSLEMKLDKDYEITKQKFYKYYAYSSLTGNELKNLDIIDINFYKDYIQL